MRRFFAYSLALSVVAIAAGELRVAPRVQAASEAALADLDDDFLPDSIEWAVLTNASLPDTDGDAVSDFVEVVQRGQPRRPGAPLPIDQELRLVATAPRLGSGDQTAHLHLLMRVIGTTAAVTSFASWFEFPNAPGTRFSFDFVGQGPATIAYRPAGAEGLWLRVSAPLASLDALQVLAPLSLHVEATVGGRILHSSIQLIDVRNVLSSLIPFDDRSFALQSVQPMWTGGQSNRVCVLELQEVPTGGGAMFQVVRADCEDCNEVECSISCPDCLGWVIDLPGGLGPLTGR